MVVRLAWHIIIIRMVRTHPHPRTVHAEAQPTLVAHSLTQHLHKNTRTRIPLACHICWWILNDLCIQKGREKRWAEKPRKHTRGESQWVRKDKVRVYLDSRSSRRAKCREAPGGALSWDVYWVHSEAVIAALHLEDSDVTYCDGPVLTSAAQC